MLYARGAVVCRPPMSQPATTHNVPSLDPSPMWRLPVTGSGALCGATTQSHFDRLRGVTGRPELRAVQHNCARARARRGTPTCTGPHELAACIQAATSAPSRSPPSVVHLVFTVKDGVHLLYGRAGFDFDFDSLAPSSVLTIVELAQLLTKPCALLVERCSRLQERKWSTTRACNRCEWPGATPQGALLLRLLRHHRERIRGRCGTRLHMHETRPRRKWSWSRCFIRL